MSNKTILTAFLLTCLYLLSCKGTYPEPRYYNPVHAQYEKAGTLGRGRVEVSGHYTTNVVLGYNPFRDDYKNMNAFGTNTGLSLGYGLSDKLDLKVRYELTSMPEVTSIPDSDFNSERTRNYFFSVIPKISLTAGKLSLLVPLSFYDYVSKQPAISNFVFREKYFSLAPTLIKTSQVKSNKIDFSAAINGEVAFLKEDYGSPLFVVFSGFNLNAGFSNNLSQWAVRPAVGYNFKFWDKSGVWNFGVGLQLTLPHSTK